MPTVALPLLELLPHVPHVKSTVETAACTVMEQ